MPTAHPEPPAPPPGWQSRGVLVAAGAIALFFFVLAYAGASWPVVVFEFLADGAMLALWLVSALAAGSFALAPVWRLDVEVPPGLRKTAEVAAGLGLIGLATLGLGLAGVISGPGVLAGALMMGAPTSWRFLRNARSADALRAPRQWAARPAGWDWLWLLALPLLAVALVAALVPPGFLWNPDEPHGYDVVGYHFQVPREWYEAGRIHPLQHNVFSFFPFATEMHYLLAMDLGGGPWRGMYLAQMMHAAHVVLAVLAVYGLASSLSQRRSIAVAAALTTAAIPWLTLLAPVGYNEGGLLLYGTLAIGWALRAVGAPARLALTRFGVAGAMAGFACGVKLTAVPMLLAAVPVAVVIAWPRGARYAWLVAVVGAAVYSPWALRNIAWTGNPVFPEGMRLLGRAHFSDVQVERWERAHSPRPDQRPIGARLAAFGSQVAFDWRFGYVPLAIGVAGAVAGYRDRRARLLAVLFAGYGVFWLGFTHLQGRFFVLAVPVAALLVAVAPWGRLAPVVAGVAGACTVASAVMVHREFSDRLSGSQRMVGVLGVEDLSGVNPPAVAGVPPDATLVLVGEARTFWFPRPMSRLRYRTVFDVDTSSEPDVVRAWRGSGPSSGAEWLLVNPSELQRFADTYWGIPQPPPEWKGKVEPAVIPPGPRR